jgi:proteasomal ATPase-associated factor 1
MFSPFVSVQPDWIDVVSDAQRQPGTFWVSCYRREGKSVHGTATVQRAGDSVTVRVSHGIEATIDTVDKQPILKVSCAELDLRNVCVHGCMRSFSPFTEKPIYALDVSPGGELYVAGSQSGNLVVGNAHNGVQRVQLTGHVGDVNVARVFPSGQVVLSAAADLTIKIWSVEDGSCPVTIRGHTRRITDVHMVERGKNIVSGSEDGTVRLWQVAQSECIDTLATFPCKVNGLAMDGGWPLESDVQHLLDVGTQGKLVVAARSDGHATALDVANRKQVFTVATHGPSECCAIDLATHRLIAGTSSGMVQTFDTRNPTQPIHQYCRNDAAITHVSMHPSTAYTVATADGMAYIQSDTSTLHELAGPALWSINTICQSRNGLYTAAEDGHVRIYPLV